MCVEDPFSQIRSQLVNEQLLNPDVMSKDQSYTTSTCILVYNVH